MKYCQNLGSRLENLILKRQLEIFGLSHWKPRSAEIQRKILKYHPEIFTKNQRLKQNKKASQRLFIASRTQISYIINYIVNNTASTLFDVNEIMYAKTLNAGFLNKKSSVNFCRINYARQTECTNNNYAKITLNYIEV